MIHRTGFCKRTAAAPSACARRDHPSGCRSVVAQLTRTKPFYFSRALARTGLAENAMAERLLTVAEASTTLRLHAVTLRAMAAAGQIPAFKLGRAWRFVEIDLLT